MTRVISEGDRLETPLVGDRERERYRGERDLLKDFDGERESKRLRVRACGDGDLDEEARSLFGLDIGAAFGGEGGAILWSLGGGGRPLG